MNIQDTTIVITGAARGLGLSMAKHFARKGANLALIDLSRHALEQCQAELPPADVAVKIYAADVTKEKEVITVFDSVINDFGTVHCLINNAGIANDSLLVKAKNRIVEKRMSLEQWQSVIDVNLTGAFLCGREAATKMIETDTKGVIINISSVTRCGNIGQANYSASKAAVASLATTWAKELARYGIRSAAIAPGYIATDKVASVKADILEDIKSRIPLNRLGDPEHIAQTAAFILENDYISGRTLEIDAALRL